MPANILNQLKVLNNKLTLNQKLSIVALGTVILLGLLSFVYLIQKDSYQLLYSNLDASSAASVIERLEQLNIPYELADGGRSVAVPISYANQARIDLASQGLPSSGRIGYELFDQNNWGITDFAEKVNYRRALEGELERTIVGLSEVSYARVHVVMEKNALFEEDREPAKASVVIKLHSGSSLNRRTVDGIRNLVAFAVEGLHSDNVTIVDVNGNLLSESREEGGLSDGQLEYRRKLERELTSKVISILEPIVGQDRVRVTTSVQIDDSEVEQTEQILDPERSVVVSRQTSEEIVGGEVLPGGIPLAANDPQAPGDGAAGAAATTGRSLQNETVNYELTKTVRQVRLPRGGIKRLSVAVVVDDKPIADGETGTAVNQMQPRDPQELDRLRNLVMATVGYSAERGDSITVENVSFSGNAPEAEHIPDPNFLQENWRYIQPALRYLLILVLFGLFYLFIFRPVKNRVFAFTEFSDPDYKQLAEATQDPELVQRLEEQMNRLSGGNQGSLPEGNNFEGEFQDSAVVKKQLTVLAQKDPTLVTQVIRSWLSEGT